MRLRLFSYLAAAAALPLRLRAQTLVVRSIGAVSVLPLDRPSALFTEMPPTLLRVPAALSPAGGCPAVAAGALALYLSTGYAGLCVANVSALAPSSPTGFALATCSVPFSGESWRSWPPAAVPPHTEWLRNYDGVFAALPLPDAGPVPQLLLVRHGEHKNELNWENDLLYQGLINRDVDARTCYSGFVNGSFSDCQPAYNAMVTGARVPFTAAACFGLGAVGNSSAVDGGPLVWPRDGYLNATRGKASFGVRQPGAVVTWSGDVVLFYIDNAFERADVWAARSPRGAGQGAPGSFFHFDTVARAWSLPALPAGFDGQHFDDFLQTPSPAGATGRGAPLFPLFPTAGSVHATAARLTVNGAPTPLHLVLYDIVNYTQCWPGDGGGGGGGARTAAAVGSRVLRDVRGGGASGGGDCVPVWRMFLRLTADFVTYTEPVELAPLAAPGWGNALLQYATLLSGDGTRQDEVDAADFFVMGTCASAAAPCGSTYGPQVTLAHVSVSVMVR